MKTREENCHLYAKERGLEHIFFYGSEEINPFSNLILDF